MQETTRTNTKLMKVWLLQFSLLVWPVEINDTKVLKLHLITDVSVRCLIIENYLVPRVSSTMLLLICSCFGS